VFAGNYLLRAQFTDGGTVSERVVIIPR
jgi:hypothetical protein